MLRRMIAEQERLRRSGTGSDYELAALHARIGDREPAIRLLRAADAAGDTALVSVRMDPRFRNLRGDPRFQEIAARVERPPERG